MYTDSQGKPLTDYPRPSLAVDTAVLSVVEQVLCVALVGGRSSGDCVRRLPGTFLHQGEVLAQAVRRSLVDKAGISNLSPEQLHVFDSPDRDSRGWVISVAHMVAVPEGTVVAVDWVPVDEVGGLAFDHDRIVQLAAARLRAQYKDWPDPGHLLGQEFTLLELERLHRAVDPTTSQRDTFRRQMERHLEATGERREGVVGKPARIFKRTRR